MIKITLPDGGVREYDASQITPMEIAKSLSNSLPKKAVAAKVDGEVKDLSTVLDQDAEVAILTFDDEEGKEVFRHSSQPCAGGSGAASLARYEDRHWASDRKRFLL